MSLVTFFLCILSLYVACKYPDICMCAARSFVAISIVSRCCSPREVFDVDLHAFDHERIENITSLKEVLLGAGYEQRRYRIVTPTWSSAGKNSGCSPFKNSSRQVQELYLRSAKKASLFNSWSNCAKNAGGSCPSSGLQKLHGAQYYQSDLEWDQLN